VNKAIKHTTVDNTHPILTELHKDHACFSRILLMISRNAQLLETDHTSVLPLFKEAVDYIVDYQNTYHHPLEETLFKLLTDKMPSLQQKADQLHKEHMMMGRAGKKMMRQLHGLEKDNQKRSVRASLAKSLVQFVDDMRIHIRNEEEIMYTQAISLLTDDDWNTIAQDKPVDDPLQGAPNDKYVLLSRYMIESSDLIRVNTENLGHYGQLVYQIRNGVDIASLQAAELWQLNMRGIRAMPSLPILHPYKTWLTINQSGSELCESARRWTQDWRDWRKDPHWKMK
jgi:hemerythrin-like domain-containing protein